MCSYRNCFVGFFRFQVPANTLKWRLGETKKGGNPKLILILTPDASILFKPVYLLHVYCDIFNCF